GRGGDGDGRRRVDDDGDLDAGRLAARVGDRRGDGVDAGAERGRRDRPAHAERTVPARAPRDVGGQVAVLEVGGGGREGDRGPREIAGPTRRGRDAHHRAAVDRDRDRRARRAVAAVGNEIVSAWLKRAPLSGVVIVTAGRPETVIEREADAVRPPLSLTLAVRVCTPAVSVERVRLPPVPSTPSRLEVQVMAAVRL